MTFIGDALTSLVAAAAPFVMPDALDVVVGFMEFFLLSAICLLMGSAEAAAVPEALGSTSFGSIPISVRNFGSRVFVLLPVDLTVAVAISSINGNVKRRQEEGGEPEDVKIIQEYENTAKDLANFAK